MYVAVFTEVSKGNLLVPFKKSFSKSSFTFHELQVYKPVNDWNGGQKDHDLDNDYKLLTPLHPPEVGWVELTICGVFYCWCLFILSQCKIQI